MSAFEGGLILLKKLQTVGSSVLALPVSSLGSGASGNSGRSPSLAAVTNWAPFS